MILLLFLILFISKAAFASNYTYNTNTTCVGKVCTVAIGGSFALDGSVWKTINEAKSLKNSSVQCSVQSDGMNLAYCFDWNTTSITVNLSSNRTINAVPVPLKLWHPTYLADDTFNSTVLKSNVSLSFVSKADVKTQTIPFTLGDILEFGQNSTTITMNETNGGNIGDSYVVSTSATTNYGITTTLAIGLDSSTIQISYLKFNISSIPASSTINSAILRLYRTSTSNNSQTSDVRYVNLTTWNEGTLNFGLCGTSCLVTQNKHGTINPAGHCHLTILQTAT
jgi:hypothetical protein